ncbi:hypothetical protein F511_17234 [Dorcoceras hygrometricum]|uniref:non-specific serine/threonine protein kinase n=1 Tax=Dorcoceras hygrometricum TaxID=472368 RepID=A0A2Z7AVN8_9LAMI|nr:hypothetical protein F511_17234 [Dorcoceras hygrometricum]
MEIKLNEAEGSLVLIKQGAEARVFESTFVGRRSIVKERFSKKYRHPSLDSKLTLKRLNAEARCMTKARKLGVSTPVLYAVDPILNTLTFEFVEGPSVKDILLDFGLQGVVEERLNDIAGQIGDAIGKLHDGGLVHGDLTTSNMLIRNGSNQLVLIDFGLSFTSTLPEDKAVDLYVLERALLSMHSSCGNVMDKILNAYRKSSKQWSSTFNKLAQAFCGGGGDEEQGINFSERETLNIKTIKTVKSFGRNKIYLDASQMTDLDNYRIFVATWNVAGKSPPSYLNLEEWLHTSPPADIYVLGFQEIVPLNAGNVLGTEDDGPARKWLSLVRKTLNSPPDRKDSCCTPSSLVYPITELDYDLEGLDKEITSTFLRRCSFQSLSHSMRLGENNLMRHRRVDRRPSVCDNVNYLHRQCDDYDQFVRWDGFGDDENELADLPCAHSHSPMSCSGSVSMDDGGRYSGKSGYCLVASKQMVGIFLMVWIKCDLKEAVQNLKVSCVGRGLMGYLGNKGSISISMSLHQTSFCFVCSHLTSGEKDGDEQRRNSDVMEILRKTRFPRFHSKGDDDTPQTILDHDRIIWLGDLNYRIALSYQYAKALVEMRNWRALLENDQASKYILSKSFYLCIQTYETVKKFTPSLKQLRIEQGQGRVFPGWNEGRIYFPPTYKYSNNSDRYTGENKHPREKRRTPAWCDRILWHGRGLQQLSYIRGESRFSDHRPVYSMFLAEVESIDHSRIKKNTNLSA